MLTYNGSEAGLFVSFCRFSAATRVPNSIGLFLLWPIKEGWPGECFFEVFSCFRIPQCEPFDHSALNPCPPPPQLLTLLLWGHSVGRWRCRDWFRVWEYSQETPRSSYPTVVSFGTWQTSKILPSNECRRFLFRASIKKVFQENLNL